MTNATRCRTALSASGSPSTAIQTAVVSIPSLREFRNHPPAKPDAGVGPVLVPDPQPATAEAPVALEAPAAAASPHPPPQIGFVPSNSTPPTPPLATRYDGASEFRKTISDHVEIRNGNGY